MKKILSFLLVATMLVAMFVMPSAAADNVNFETQFDFAEKAPDIDGVVKKGEYGTLPVHSYPENKAQFEDVANNDYPESAWDFDFYGAWDAEYLYMAWVLNTETHVGLPETDHNGDGTYDINDSNFMWQYSCVQFIFTAGIPNTNEVKFQTAQWSGDYLEVGLALSAEGEQIRAVWSKPSIAPDLEVNDWDAAIVRDDAKKTTTYEVRIPWSKSGLAESGNGAKFGLTYAVAAQEFYDATDATKGGMIEWQDAILGGKNADNAAVIELTGNEEIEKSEIPQEKPVTKEEGTIPADAEGKTQLTIDGVNTAITSEMAYIYTDPSALAAMNTKWATNVLLAPVEGEEGTYTVKEVVVGAGEEIAFTTEITDGMLVYAAHSDGQGTGNARKEAATALVVDSTVKFFGVDFEKADTEYSNAMFYVLGEAGGETSGEVSEEESSAAVSEPESTVESSEAPSEAESSTAAAESSEATTDDEGGLGVWLWVIIGVAVVAIAAVVFVVLKKKQ